MKRNPALILAILALIFSALNFTQNALAQQTQTGSKAVSPSMVSYQGYVTVNGSPYSGTGYFKFAILDDGGTSLWSNDGSSTGGGEPTSAVQLTVSNGLFSVLLGDTSLAGMIKKLVLAVFSTPNTFLRVWFSPNGSAGTFTQLGPDRRFSAVPYAFYAEVSSNANTLGGLAPAAYQRDLLGKCPPGYAVLEVLDDGTLTCLPVQERPGFALTTLDSADMVGSYSSITTGADGLGLISYHDSTNGNLKVAHCNDLACTSATTATLDNDGIVGWHTSITIGADGLGLISYYDQTNGNLKVAHCNDLACSSATAVLLDSAGNVGSHSSITIGADGLGLISYYDHTNGNLKVAHCNDLACASATPYTLDPSAEQVGWYTSITIGADGLGLISYYDVTNTSLKVAHCNDAICTSATFATLDSFEEVGSYTSITIGADGLGLISYYNYTNSYLSVAHCNNTACSTATYAALNSAGDVGSYTSITVGADGLGLVSYYDASNGDLKMAHCSNTACNSATLTTLDPSAGDVGRYTAITIGADGLGLISYFDASNGDLKVAHLSNTLGTPWTRRR